MSERTVELFVDPTCPFAWMTSRWLLHAAAVREITPRFSLMSLAVLNEGRDLDPGYRAHIDDAWGCVRVGVRVAEDHGPDAFSDWYTAWGERYHVGENHDRRAVAHEALDAVGLPLELMEHYDPVPGDETDTQLRAAHERAISLVGDDVGTPVISFGTGTAYFGPVISPAPKGEDAGRLLDGLLAMSSVEGFYELKRSRTGGIDFS